VFDELASLVGPGAGAALESLPASPPLEGTVDPHSVEAKERPTTTMA
jgi:hypothetical protein